MRGLIRAFGTAEIMSVQQRRPLRLGVSDVSL